MTTAYLALDIQPRNHTPLDTEGSDCKSHPIMSPVHPDWFSCTSNDVRTFHQMTAWSCWWREEFTAGRRMWRNPTAQRCACLFYLNCIKVYSVEHLRPAFVTLKFKFVVWCCWWCTSVWMGKSSKDKVNRDDQHWNVNKSTVKWQKQSEQRRVSSNGVKGKNRQKTKTKILLQVASETHLRLIA